MIFAFVEGRSGVSDAALGGVYLQNGNKGLNNRTEQIENAEWRIF